MRDDNNEKKGRMTEVINGNLKEKWNNNTGKYVRTANKKRLFMLSQIMSPHFCRRYVWSSITCLRMFFPDFVWSPVSFVTEMFCSPKNCLVDCIWCRRYQYRTGTFLCFYGILRFVSISFVHGPFFSPVLAEIKSTLSIHDEVHTPYPGSYES